MKKNIAFSLLGAVGALALMATTASAAVVCNDDGDCWKTTTKLTYPPAARVHVYGDDYVIDKKKYRLREARPGSGYYRGGVWVQF
jgi:hypothetical protein